jgi:hypothetical protein
MKGAVAVSPVYAQAVEQVKSILLVIDEETVDNETSCSDADFATAGCISIQECAASACPGVVGPPINNDPAVLINADRASIPGTEGGCLEILRINDIADLDGMPSITLPTGQTGDEGIFTPTSNILVGTTEGVPGYIGCSPYQNENILERTGGVPLNADSIFELEGRRICGVVYDNDVGDLGGGQLNLAGARMGRTAFDIVRVVPHPQGGNLLPVLEVKFLGGQEEVDKACACDNIETIDGQPYECPPL